MTRHWGWKVPKICYETKRFSQSSLALITKAVEILEDYAARGYDLTLRQLYYQFVARDIIPNKDTEYKRLGSIINDARMAGLIDWDHIEDRTRNLAQMSSWESPASIMESVVRQYRENPWLHQTNYVEVWVEKEALAGVVQVACDPLMVPYFSCRGYTSQSEMWGAAMRLVEKLKEGKDITILHLGDHDPSGIDMTRDIEDRLRLFIRRHTYRGSLDINRIALNMSQIDEHNPPPNPAKTTDSRFTSYQDQYGEDSWELDSLDPDLLVALIAEKTKELIDGDEWHVSERNQERNREVLRKAQQEMEEE